MVSREFVNARDQLHLVLSRMKVRGRDIPRPATTLASFFVVNRYGWAPASAGTLVARIAVEPHIERIRSVSARDRSRGWITGTDG